MTSPGSHAGDTGTAGVDVGGTFTDVVALVDRPTAVKVPTTPSDQGEGVVDGLSAAGTPEPEAVAHGTTTATNAVLERNIGRTVLVTTHGFADVLGIARQDRPSLYDLGAVRPRHLAADVVTVAERTGPDGRPLEELDDAEIERVVDDVARAEPDTVALSLLFAYAGPAHEERLEAALTERLGGVPVTRSSALLPEFREYERASTCVLNAAIAPVMRRYLRGLARRLPGTTITVMTSGGGTAGLDFCADAPVHTLLSGPAAGVVAAGAVAASAGFDDAVAFDMGGTSTDVCLIRGGQPEVATEAEIAGLPFRTPAVAIHTVGAGGGSIAALDAGGALQVGPRSAGARPGPACYGLGGTEPTVTDAHCALGHLDPERALGGGLQLDRGAAEAALDRLPEGAGADGVLAVVRATMVRALQRVSTERGVDPSGLALVAYGGAGPLHATALARDLGCRAVVVPPAPGVLSALGLLLAPLRYEALRTVMVPAAADLADIWSSLEDEASEQLRRQRPGGPPPALSRVADCRYEGQSHELRLDLGAGAAVDVADRFHSAHEAAYGYAMRNEPVRVVTARVVAEADPALEGLPTGWDQGEAHEPRRRTIGVGGERLEATVLDRAALTAGDAVDGPALVEQPDTTTLLGPGERAEVDQAGNLVVRW